MATATERKSRQKRTPHEQMLALLRRHAGIRAHEVTDTGTAGWPCWTVHVGQHELYWYAGHDGRALAIYVRPAARASVPGFDEEPGRHYGSPQQAVKAVTAYSRYAANYSEESVGYDEAKTLPACTAVAVTLGWKKGNGFVPEVAVRLTRYVEVPAMPWASRQADVTVRLTGAAAVHMANQYLDHDVPLAVLLDWVQDHAPELNRVLALPAARQTPVAAVRKSSTGAT